MFRRDQESVEADERTDRVMAWALTIFLVVACAAVWKVWG